MDEKIKLTFDEDSKVRALDPAKFSKADELQKECMVFSEKINTFQEKTNTLVQVLEGHAKKIDNQKLRAIGFRILIENEVNNRVKQQNALQAIIKDKKLELEKCVAQLRSLENIETEQRSVLEKCSATVR